jgi:hypothetical protein
LQRTYLTLLVRLRSQEPPPALSPASSSMSVCLSAACLMPLCSAAPSAQEGTNLNTLVSSVRWLLESVQKQEERDSVVRCCCCCCC